MEREPLLFPLNAVDTFKEFMKEELEKEFDDSTDIDRKNSDKENSTLENIEVIEDDSPLSDRVKKYNARRTCPKKLKRNLRSKRQTSVNPVETILVGDAEEEEEEKDSKQHYSCRRRLKPTSRKRSDSSSHTASGDIIMIEDDDSVVVETSNSSTKNASLYDDIKEEINVKIDWMHVGASKFKLRKNEPFSKIYSLLAETKNINKDCIVLYKGDMRISPEDTPASINLTIIDILKGFTVTEPVFRNSTTEKNTKDPNAIEVKVIMDSKKNKEMLFSLNKNENMSVLFIKIAKQLDYDVSDVQLWFDGEKVCEDDTVTDLDLEGGECFELKLKNT